METYINNKIEGYKEQDKQAGREITENYVDWGWFETEFGKKRCCVHCQVAFEFNVDKDKEITSDLTFDRIDDGICHSNDNMVLNCWHCNCCKINKKSNITSAWAVDREFFDIYLPLWLPGVSLERLWCPLGRLWAPFSLFWEHLGCLWILLGCPWAPFGSLWGARKPQ